jgi:DNA-binding FadR family transcriptional regulator
MEQAGSLLHVVDRSRSYLHVAELLRQEIRRLNVGEGGRLPSEREFAQRLNISRPSLREALIVLELRGEIDIRVGSGIYLKRDVGSGSVPGDGAPSEAASGVQDAAFGHSPREVSQMRFFLESGVAAYAARFISKAQLGALEASVAAMRRGLSRRARLGDKPLADADRQFHVALAQPTDNRLLINTLKELFDQRYSPVADSMHRRFDNADVWQQAVQEHQDIFEAVADRDPLQAQAAMQRHLTRAHARLMTVIG